MGIIRQVASRIKYTIPEGTWIFAVSDIHLSAKQTSASHSVEKEFTRVISENMAREHGVIVLNGDIIELWAGERPSVAKALKAHAKLQAAIAEFAKSPNHKVYFVIGNHDGKIGWDKTEQKSAKDLLGAELCFALELTTPSGGILFEHGHSFDADNSFSDPRSPHDTPLGQHIVQQALPLVRQTQGKLLDGIDHLSDPHQFPKFVASRVMYRELLNRSWWLLVPILITLFGRIIIELGIYRFEGFPIGRIAQIILFTELAVFVNVAFIVLVIVMILQNVLKHAKDMPGGVGSGAHHNDHPRAAAEEAIGKGNLGLITGHTHRPEALKINHGFYANSGCGTRMVGATKARFGLPKTYVGRNHLSWLELEYTDALDIRLFTSAHVLKDQTWLERAMTKKRHMEQPLHLAKHIKVEL